MGLRVEVNKVFAVLCTNGIARNKDEDTSTKIETVATGRQSAAYDFSTIVDIESL